MRNGWVETTFGDIFKIVAGKYVAKEEYVEGGEFWIYGSNSIMGKLDRFLVEQSHVVMAAIGAYAGAVRYSKNPSWINNNAMALVPSEKVIAKYLHLWLESKFDLKRVVVGTGQPYVQRPLLLKEIIALPPLPEQKRIVDLISSVDSYIEALQQQLESAKKSKNAYVNTIVFETFARGKKTKIADIAEVKGGKRLPKGTPWSEEPTDHRYIRATDIKDGIVLSENLVYVPDDVWPVISRYVVNEGDVVITIAGTIGQVGVNLTENAAKIVVNRKLVRSSYLGMLLGSSYYQLDIDSKTKKTTQPKLGLNMIDSIEIPLPDLAEQDEISSVVSHFDSLIATTKDQITKANTLRTGLLDNLLSGEHEIPASYDKAMSAA